tara:strand:+ start:728 stop:1858 length:1131 start_codon:yes stop_codon:yes gene_type:complete
MAKKNIKREIASPKTYRFGGRVSVEGMTIAQLCESKCQTSIFDISADGRNPGKKSTAGQRIYYSQQELLENKDFYLNKIDPAFQFLPEPGDQCVAPEQALFWLTLNTKNRTVSDARVLKVAEAMVKGEWANTGDPITFCTEDHGRTYYIISGQARLWAMWLTNCHAEHTIRFTTDSRVQGVIDTGKTRTVADLLSASGFAKHRFIGHAASIVRGYVEHDPPYLGATTWEAAPRYPANDIKDWLTANTDFTDRVDFSYPSLRQCSRMLRSPAWSTGMEYLLHMHCANPSLSDQFWADLETGVNLEQGDPVLTLREQLMRDRADKKFNKLSLVAMVIKAWNYRMRGRRIKDVRWRSSGANAEPFPEILAVHGRIKANH